ncbi:hypothetical protein [Neisseria sp. 74A18]|uniref:hypothetical protein n=1 Tax=Neisseria sp. 74A18 TaxID=1696094 RepID=UPI0006CACC5B|nr:hypothetical protein [Neisseria sp. 74A18]KPN74640.1 hypothetical protein AKG43_00940 [Neisseria sp. 74A18]
MKKFALILSLAAMSAAVTAAPAEQTIKKPGETKVSASKAAKTKSADKTTATATPLDASGVNIASGVVK